MRGCALGDASERFGDWVGNRVPTGFHAFSGGDCRSSMEFDVDQSGSVKSFVYTHGQVGYRVLAHALNVGHKDFETLVQLGEFTGEGLHHSFDFPHSPEVGLGRVLGPALYAAGQ